MQKLTFLNSVRRYCALWVNTFLFCFAGLSLAQTPSELASFPNKPIRLIVTNSAGSGVDITARSLAQGLSELYKQQVVVENRPGAGGIIGDTFLLQAPADGYTIGIAATAHIVAPLLQPKPPYKPVEDFTPIALVTSIPNLVITSSKTGIKSLKELVDQVHAKPGQFNFGSLGDGTSAHFSAEILNRAAKLDVVHVPYKSITDTYTAVWNGDLQYVVYLSPSGLPLLQGNRAIAIATTGRTRSSSMPDLPTVTELGYPDATSEVNLGIIGPPNLSPKIAQRLHDDLVTVMKRADVKERFLTQGGVPAVDASIADYLKTLKEDEILYRKLITSMGLKK
ncbi:MAG: tripartite tricarboxylate transporter substrate binding protein [Betaproteobacteria bacterium]